MSTKLIWLSIVTLCLWVSCASSYKILVVCPMPSRSHNSLGKGIAEILHGANHEVTFITAYPNGNKTNFREVAVSSEHLLKDSMMTSFDTLSKTSNWEQLTILPKMMRMLMEATLNSDNVKVMMNDKNETFDLVIIEYFFNSAFAGFGVKYNCPVIMLSPVSLLHWLARITGNPISPATIPNVFLGFGKEMDFGQRVLNTLMATFQELMGNLFIENLQRDVYENYFPEESARLPFSKLYEKIRLIYSNSHPSIAVARPFLPNVIEIGGYHIKEGDSLSSDYKEILDTAKNGVIFFSMGSNLKSSQMPDEVKRDILKALSKRKETILWKYEEDLPNKPPNVIIRSWMPQASILTHPNVKLFISHGGYLSTTEAAAAGVPILSIPIFGDQFTNAKSTQDRGCGIMLEFTNLTETSLTWALNEVLNNKRYAETAKDIHKAFHDRPILPKNLVVFYAEHVIRTGGAKHLSAPHLPLYASLLLDVIVVLLLPPLLIILVTLWMCKKCCGKSKSQTKAKQKKH